MNKLTALITTAILGISSAAIAKPVAPPQVADAQHDHDRDYNNDRDRADRFDDRGRYDHTIRRGPSSRWLDLGIARTGKTTIQIGSRTRFSSLRLDVNGWLRVNQVLVRFADGTERLIKLQHANMSNRDPLVVDLGGSKRVNSVIVYASRYGRGSVQVSGLESRRYYFNGRG